MRAIIKPSLAPHLHLDVTHALTATIAGEIARAVGGNDVVNWLEAERILQGLLSGGSVESGAALEPQASVTPGRAEPKTITRRGRAQVRYLEPVEHV